MENHELNNTDDLDEGLELTAADKKRRRKRSIAIAFSLIFLVVLFYLLTILKFGPEIMNKPL
ncbi:MAG: hypothetical protein ABJO09_07985 [Hyphomicrobiales bacterium]